MSTESIDVLLDMIPPGWKLVPVDPTQQMIHKGTVEGYGPLLTGVVYQDRTRNTYQAMIDESPQPTQSDMTSKISPATRWHKRTQELEAKCVRLKQIFSAENAGLTQPVDPVGYFHMHNGHVTATQLTRSLMECMTGEDGRIPLYAVLPNEIVLLHREIERLTKLIEQI